MLTMDQDRIEELARLYGWEFVGIDLEEGKVVLRKKNRGVIYSPLPKPSSADSQDKKRK